MSGIIPKGGDDFYDEGYDDDEESLDNRIVFREDQFYGRETELKALHEIYNNISHDCKLAQKKNRATTPPKYPTGAPVTLVSGYSGTGKSALVNRFVTEVNQKAELGQVQPCYYLKGKFEEFQTATPFSAISEAFAGFAHWLMEDPQVADKKRVAADINAKLGSEVEALASAVPSLLMVTGTSEKSSLTANNTAPETAWNRLKYLFQGLIQAISTPARPVVLFLDDMQWADEASLELILSLLKDTSLKHFQCIVAIRFNEVDDDHPFSKTLQALEDSGRIVNRMELSNLSMEAIGELIAGTLELEVNETEELTKAIYGKTRGNIFFARQALEELFRKNVLFYSVISFRWEWNLKGVDMEAGLSDNVIEAVAAKIQSVPEPLQQALTIAAYTRASIERGTLQILLETMGCQIDETTLIRLLDIAVLEGLLLNSVGSESYRFAHDKIQQASYSLCPAGPKRDDLRRKIGLRLYDLAQTSSGEDWMYFIAADHLNANIHEDPNSDQYSILLTEINLVCGEKATEIAAFMPASQYLRKSLHCLKRYTDHWRSQYDLSLRLYRTISDVELCLGNFDLGIELGQNVLRNGKSLYDKLPTYLSLAVAKGRQEHHEEALELCRTALRLLGDYPNRFHILQIAKNFRAVKRFFKKHSDYDVLLLPKMKDPVKLATMKFYSEGTLRAYLSGNLVEFMLCTLRMLRISFRFGLCGETAQSLANYGVFLNNTGHHQDDATRMSRLCKQVLEVTKSKRTESLALLTTTLFIDVWYAPHGTTLEAFQRAHKAGMETGDIEEGFRNWCTSNFVAYSFGYPLDAVEKSGTEMLEQLKLYGVDSISNIMAEFRLPIVHLVGAASRAPDWDELLEVPLEPKDISDTYRLLTAYISRLELAVIMGKYEVAISLAERLANLAEHDSAYVYLSHRIFYSGLAYMAVGQKTGQWRYRKKSKMCASKMRKLTRTKGLNTLHKALLLEAELYAMQSNKLSKVRETYEEAIAACMKSGHTQDAALGSEFAGTFFLKSKDLLAARFFFSQARNLYRDWGAVKKVEALQRERGEYLDAPSVVATITTNSLVGGLSFKSSADISIGRKSIDLDLLSGHTPKTGLPMTKPKQEEYPNPNEDEISFLTDPSESEVTRDTKDKSRSSSK